MVVKLVSHIKDRIQMEGTGIQSAEKSIWNQVGGRNCIMRRVVICISCRMLSEWPIKEYFKGGEYVSWDRGKMHTRL